MTAYPNPTPVTVLTRTRSGYDVDGNDIYTNTPAVIPDCVIWPLFSAERGVHSAETVQGGETVVIGLNVLLPPDTDVSAISAAIVDGFTYEVLGEPARWKNPFTGYNPGVLAQLRRVTG